MSYLYANHLQTPRLAISQSQFIVWRWDSDGFGIAAASGSTTINIRFPGQYYDAESDLHYNHHRYPGSILGIYITSDPIGFQGGMNTYLYANSIINIDSLGLVDPLRGRGSTLGDKYGSPGSSIGFGVGGSFLIGVIGLSVGSGYLYDSMGNTCQYSITCINLGVSFSALVHVTGQISSGNRLCGGDLTTATSFSSGYGSVRYFGFDVSESRFSASVQVGVGAGYSISIGDCLVDLKCNNDSCECS